MNKFEYTDPARQRAAVDPAFHRTIDSAAQQTEDGRAKAERVIREADSSRAYPLAARSEHADSQTGFSGLDAAAFLFAAIMTLGPLFAGFITNMHG